MLNFNTSILAISLVIFVTLTSYVAEDTNEDVPITFIPPPPVIVPVIAQTISSEPVVLPEPVLIKVKTQAVTKTDTILVNEAVKALSKPIIKNKVAVKVAVKKDKPIEKALVLAVAHVESNGEALHYDGRIKARFERHWMRKCLKKMKFSLANISKADFDLVSSKPNRKSRKDDYLDIARAEKIHKECAYRSTSWGKYQIMGMNFKSAGYDSAIDMVTNYRANPRTQHQSWIKFLKAYRGGLAYKALINKNFSKFGLIYNGKRYKARGYHTKVEKAYKRFKKKLNMS